METDKVGVGLPIHLPILVRAVMGTEKNQPLLKVRTNPSNAQLYCTTFEINHVVLPQQFLLSICICISTNCQEYHS